MQGLDLFRSPIFPGALMTKHQSHQLHQYFSFLAHVKEKEACLGVGKTGGKWEILVQLVQLVR